MSTLLWAGASFIAFSMYGGAVLGALQMVGGFDMETQAARLSFSAFVSLFAVALAVPCAALVWKAVREGKRAGAVGVCIGAVTAFLSLESLLERAFAGKF